MWRLLYTLFMALAVLLGQVPNAQAQRPLGRYRPTLGQAGKDVVWVPTAQASLDGMLAMARLTAADRFIELGSGDGRVSIAAAQRFGARALGIEYEPDLVTLARHNAEVAGVADRVAFVEADLFDVDLCGADVIGLYLLPHLNLKLRPKLLDLPAGTRIVSQSFGMGDWRPDARSMRAGRQAFLWIVPAKVEGDWHLAHEGGDSLQLALRQHYQFIVGAARHGAEAVRLRDPRLSGAHIQFVLATRAEGRRQYVGRIEDGRMHGTVRAAGAAPTSWTAWRIGAPDDVARPRYAIAPCATSQ